MSTREPNPIFVRWRVRRFTFGWSRAWEWNCTRCEPGLFAVTWGLRRTPAAAADAGRAHLASFHTAQMPPGWSKDVTVNAALDQFEDEHPEPTGYSRSCGVHVTSCAAAECVCASVDGADVSGPHRAARPFGVIDFPCCTTPMQHAYDTSRSTT